MEHRCHRTQAVLKRTFDIVASAAGLLVLSPLLALIALLIKLGSSGPVFYRGARVGRGNVDFRIFKFRSMVANAEAIGGSSTPEDDPRITRIGALLRRHKLDELPQLFNVFWGDMSFVGPRPQVRWAVELYNSEQRALLSVRPGITDYASLRFSDEAKILEGSKDPDKDYLEKIAPEKIRLGLEYVRHQSLVSDIRILVATVLKLTGFRPNAILLLSGSSQEPNAPLCRKEAEYGRKTASHGD